MEALPVGSLPEPGPPRESAQGFAAPEGAVRAVGSVFLSTLPARPRDQRFALVAVLVSLITFGILAPFANHPLPQVAAFLPAYQAALLVCYLVTAVVLFGQYSILGAPDLRLLASGFLFSALMIVAHTLSFPGLFSETGLLGAGPQTTAWIYMFWHGGFSLFVIAYAWPRSPRSDGARGARSIVTAIAVTIALVVVLTLLTTRAHDLLPPVMVGNHYTSSQLFVITLVWLLGFAALTTLWRRARRSVLDLWLMVVMCAMLLDVALCAVLNDARFDLGWYSGRIYGLLAAGLILTMLLLETRVLYARLVGPAEAERSAAQSRAEQLQFVNAALRDSQEQLRGANETLEERVRERVRQLQVTEQRQRDLVDLMQEAIWVHADGKILFANPAAVRFFAAGSMEELLGRPSIGWVHPDDRERAAERTRKLTTSPCSVPVTEMRLVALDGKVKTAALHAVSFMQDGKLHVMASALDVTALREAESQLHQSQKMESVGQLTGGVAHDFNNLLTVVIGSLDTALEKAPADLRPLLQAALGASERGASLVKQMLAFSRRQLLAPEPLDLSRLAEGLEELLRRTLGEDIEIEMRPAPDLWLALADKGQVESALLNLAINARDAMSPGGKLTIETRNAHLDDDYARTNDEVRPGDYVMLAVTDTGSGMPPEVIARAFEPFFTTKATGKGTGLGLSMIYGFVKQSGGHLKIYSEVGHGTTIRVYLPRHVSQPVPVTPASMAAAASDHPRGRETILVVEDEQMVRDLIAKHLGELGYRVLEAFDGPSAQRILDGPEAIDLLLSDLVLPGTLTGGQLAETARQTRPQLKILFSSGYTEHAVAHQGKLDPGVQFISKPFRRADLAAKVRAVLDGTTPG